MQAMAGSMARALALCILLVAGVVLVSQAEARADSARQQCLQELERTPHDIRANLIVPQQTEISIVAFYSGVEGCDAWERLSKYRVQLKQHGQWRDLNGNFWYPTDGRDVPDKNAAHGFCFLDFATDEIHEEREHGHWQPARVRFINFVKNVDTGKIVGHGDIKDHPVTLGYSGPCGARSDETEAGAASLGSRSSTS